MTFHERICQLATINGISGSQRDFRALGNDYQRAAGVVGQSFYQLEG